MTTKLFTTDMLDNATRSAYSEDSYFPASNLYDGNARSRVYRSAGYFAVTSSNNVIRFEETSATPLSATIAEANYTSDATFLAAVKDALDTAGASTYTVSRNTTTKKITIASDGGGGGGIFTLLWTDGSTTAADLLGFDDAADDSGALTYTADNISIHTEERLTWDLGVAMNPQAFILTGLRPDGVQISSSATLKLQANATEVWSSPSVDQTLTWDSDVIFYGNTSGIGSYRYWSLSIVDTDNPNGCVEISNVFLGNPLDISEGSVQRPISGTLTDGSEISRGPNLNASAVARSTSSRFDLTYKFLTKAEKERFETFFQEYKKARPFFVNLDDGAVFGSSSTTYLMLCRIGSDPTWSFENSALRFDLRFDLIEEV